MQWQYIRRVEGEKCFTMYLAFRRRVSSEGIFFKGLVGFYGTRLEASAISCPIALFLFFTRGFGDSVDTSCHTNCCPKTEFLFPISADEKGATSVFRVLANHSASFFFLHPVRRFVQTTICIQYIPFFIHPVTECKHLLAFILTRVCYFSREESTYIPYSFFNGQSLAAC